MCSDFGALEMVWLSNHLDFGWKFVSEIRTKMINRTSKNQTKTDCNWFGTNFVFKIWQQTSLELGFDQFSDVFLPHLSYNRLYFWIQSRFGTGFVRFGTNFVRFCFGFWTLCLEPNIQNPNEKDRSHCKDIHLQ